MLQNTRGALIVFEGLDRCGKTTQTQLLLEYLDPNYQTEESKIVQLMRFPDRTIPSGQKIDEYLCKKITFTPEEIHALFAQNRKECKQKILDALNSGKHVIIDRYAYSGVAYSAAKGLDIEWCKPHDSGLPKPDLIFYIDLTEEEVASRSGFGDEVYERIDFQKKVREAYHQLKEDDWHMIPGVATKEKIHSDITQIIDNYLRTFRSQTQKEIEAMQELW